MIAKFRNLSYSMLESLLQFFGLLVFVIFLMRKMPVERFGVYTLLYAIASFGSSFLQGFTDKAFIKFYAEKQKSKYIVATVFLNLALGTILCILMLLASPLIKIIFKDVFGFFSLCLACGIILTACLRNIGKSVFVARMNFKFVFLQTLFWVIFLNFSVLFLDFNGLLSPQRILIAHILANFFVAIIIFIQIKLENIQLKINPTFFELKQTIVELVGFGKYSLGISIAFLFYTQVDTLLIGALLGTTEVGLYEIPKRIFTFARLYSNSISQILFPKIVKHTGDVTAQAKLFFSAIKYGPLGGIFLAIVSFFSLPFFLSLVFGEKYLSVLPVAQLVSVLFVIHPISNFSGNTLGALNKPKEDLKTLIITFVINIALDVALIPLFSISGAAYATLITVLIGGMINFNKVRRILALG